MTGTLALAMLAAPALAQDDSGDAAPPVASETGASGREVYTPADFARFAPRTAPDAWSFVWGTGLSGVLLVASRQLIVLLVGFSGALAWEAMHGYAIATWIRTRS